MTTENKVTACAGKNCSCQPCNCGTKCGCGPNCACNVPKGS